MKQIKIFTYRLDLALLNKYLEVIKKFLEPKVLNEKVEVLFFFFILQNKTSIFSLNFFFNSLLIKYQGDSDIP